MRKYIAGSILGMSLLASGCSRYEVGDEIRTGKEFGKSEFERMVDKLGYESGVGVGYQFDLGKKSFAKERSILME